MSIHILFFNLEKQYKVVNENWSFNQWKNYLNFVINFIDLNCRI